MIAKLLRFALHQRFVTLLAGLTLIGLGIWAFNQLQIEAYPDISDTQVVVITLFPGRAAEEVEQQVTRDACDLSRHIMDNAKQRAEEEARRIISLAIQRYAGSHTFETTTATWPRSTTASVARKSPTWEGRTRKATSFPSTVPARSK